MTNTKNYILLSRKKIIALLMLSFVSFCFLSFCLPCDAYATVAEDYTHGDGLDKTAAATKEAMDRFKADLTSWSCGYPSDANKFINDLSQDCWFCGAFNTVIEALETLAKAVYANVKDGLISFLSACLAVWLVVKILGYVAVVHIKSPGEFYTEIGTGILRVAFVYVALTMGMDIWNYIVAPLADMAYSYASVAMSSVKIAGTTAPTTTISTADVGEGISPISVIGERIVGNDKNNAGGIIAAINGHLMRLIATGWVLASAAMNNGLLCFPMNDFYLFLAGVLLIAMGVVFLFFIPVLVLDLCFRLGIFLVLLPTFIFAWAFPIIRGYAARGMNLLIQPLFMLLIVAIALAICTQMIDSQLFPKNKEGEDLLVLSNSLDDNLKQFRGYYGGDLTNLLKAVFLLVFAYEIMKKIASIVDNLVPDSGRESDFGGRTGRRAIRSLAKLGAKLSWSTVKLGGAITQAGVRNVSRGTSFDASVRDAKRDGQAASLVNEYKNQSGTSTNRRAAFNTSDGEGGASGGDTGGNQTLNDNKDNANQGGSSSGTNTGNIDNSQTLNDNKDSSNQSGDASTSNNADNNQSLNDSGDSSNQSGGASTSNNADNNQSLNDNEENSSQEQDKNDKLKDVVMPSDVAQKINEDPNYQLTPDDVKKVLAANRYRRKGIGGRLQDLKDNSKARLKETLYSKATGEKSRNFY